MSSFGVQLKKAKNVPKSNSKDKLDYSLKPVPGNKANGHDKGIL